MNRLITLFCCSIVLFGLASCHSDEPQTPPDEPVDPVRRTILVYMEARNSLASNATDDLNEMAAAVIPDDCRLVVYASTRDTVPMLLELKNGEFESIKLYDNEVSAVDVEQMTTVFADMREAAPAAEYGVVLWSHSTGWEQTQNRSSRGFGYEYSSRMMSISELAQALATLNPDFVFFDTCYMGCVEVAYELRNCVQYMVGSVCEVPAPGMSYDLTLEHLFAEDMVAGLIEAIDLTVDGYIADNSANWPSTLSLIKLSALDALAAEVKAKQCPLPDDYVAQRFSASNPFKNLFFDFGQYFNEIGGDFSLLAAAVLHERHSSTIWGRLAITHCSGLSIYLPELTTGYDYSSYGYSSLAWAQDVLNL